MVQMKDELKSLLGLEPELYIPHGSDES